MAPSTTRNHRVRIEQATESLDAEREAIPTWTPFAVGWAKITTVVGGETYSGRQIHAEANRLIEMAYVAGVTPKMRALFRGQVFDFKSVENVDERNVDLAISAQVRV